MPIHNADIASTFEQIADLLDIQGDNPFRIRAYRKAARTLLAFEQDCQSLIASGTSLPKLPGLGTDLAQKIHEIVTTGHCQLLDDLQKKSPAGLPELLRVPSLGPKRVQVLSHQLGVVSIPALLHAAQTGQIQKLPGFGKKTEQRLLNVLQIMIQKKPRFSRTWASQYAQSLLAYLRQVKGVGQVVIAGSYRRCQDTVGDIDILVTQNEVGLRQSLLMEQFVHYDEVRTVLAQGVARSSVILQCGLQVDLRLVQRDNYGAALHYFTGSKAHNIKMRQLAMARGLKLNEYGVFRGKKRVAGETEESVFAALDLAFIPPELREDKGEIEAARERKLPTLITLQDLRGDLHVHTRASDGRNTMKEMAFAAQKKGLSYIAITDHSPLLSITHGLNKEQLVAQIDEIRILNGELSGLTIFSGSEVDILEDGRLDLPDDVLEKLDIVVAAIHSKFDLPGDEQTERLLNAMDNPYVTILAHPTGRLIGSREPSRFDFHRILIKAKEKHIILEINSQPDRLDLDALYAKMAGDAGVLMSINSDAHSSVDFLNLQHGIIQARRAWLQPDQVVNTLECHQLKVFLLGRRKQQ